MVAGTVAVKLQLVLRSLEFACHKKFLGYEVFLQMKNQESELAGRELKFGSEWSFRPLMNTSCWRTCERSRQCHQGKGTFKAKQGTLSKVGVVNSLETGQLAMLR